MNSPAPLSPTGERITVNNRINHHHLNQRPVVDVVLASDKPPTPAGPFMIRSPPPTSSSIVNHHSSYDHNSSAITIADESDFLSCFQPEQAQTAKEVCELYREALEQHVLPSISSVDDIQKQQQRCKRSRTELEQDDLDDAAAYYDDDDCMSVLSDDLDSIAACSYMDSYFSDVDSIAIRRRQEQVTTSATTNWGSSSSENLPSSSFPVVVNVESVQAHHHLNINAQMTNNEYGEGGGDDDDDDLDSIDTLYSFEIQYMKPSQLQDSKRRRTM